MRKLITGLFLLLLLIGAYSIAGAQGNENTYPLRATGYTLDNPLPNTDAQAFHDLTGVPIPLDTMQVIANTPVLLCRGFCYLSGLLISTEFITLPNGSAVQVFASPFQDWIAIAVYRTTTLGDDGNPHPQGYWWVNVDKFQVVFPEIEYQEE